MALQHRTGWDPHFLQRSPWLWPLAHAVGALPVAAHFPQLATLDALYQALPRPQPAPPLCFQADQRRKRTRTPVPFCQRYDSRIVEAAEVPTRPNNWHDTLNALCFATWPNAKLALHRRQYDAARDRFSVHAPQRSREEDTLTLFDEGGILIATRTAASKAAQAALQGGLNDLLRLERQRQLRIVPFGHALFEHLIEGLPCPEGASLILELDTLPHAPQMLHGAIDAQLARLFQDKRHFRSPQETTGLQLGAPPAAPPPSDPTQLQGPLKRMT